MPVRHPGGDLPGGVRPGRRKTAAAVRFCAKVLTGLPSILAGVFAYAAVVLSPGTFSAAGRRRRPVHADAAHHHADRRGGHPHGAARGCARRPSAWAPRRRRWSGTCVLPTALPGILTGVMLAVARAAGETAPLLFTALFSDYWLDAATPMEPTASLAVLIYNFSGSPFENQIEMAWAASLVLVLHRAGAEHRRPGAVSRPSECTIAGVHTMVTATHDDPATPQRQRPSPTATTPSSTSTSKTLLLRQLQGRARHAPAHQEAARSPPSSARRAAARARCCAASTA